MDAAYWQAPLKFLLETGGTFYSGIVLLRLILQLVRADYYNPLCQFVVKATHPPLRPLRRVIPALGRFDTASLVLALMVQWLAITLTAALQGLSLPSIGALAILGVAQLVELTLDIYVAIILGSALASWVAPYSRSPVVALLDSLAEPVLDPVRRILPAIGGLDLSPLVALVGIEVLRMLLLPPLQHLLSLV